MSYPCRRLAIMAVLPVLPALCSGPMGHFIKSSHTIREISQGRMEAPPELKKLLQDPECRRAFNGGSVGPDIVEEKSHYGNTADLARRLMEDARKDMRAAAAGKDPKAFEEARRELAFAYGWLHHCAADLNTHPVVNGRVGDTFRHLDGGGRLSHGVFEGQETTYLKQTVWNPEDRYDVYVPAGFLARETGIPLDEVERGRATVQRKALLELAETGKVTLSHEELKRMWETAVRGGFQDARDFLNDPSRFKNWDLDCGRLSTAEFDELRREVLALNKGQLPPGWGKHYLEWFETVKGLNREQRAAMLRKLMGLGSVPPPVPPPPGGGSVARGGPAAQPAAPARPGGAWVLVGTRTQKNLRPDDGCYPKHTLDLGAGSAVGTCDYVNCTNSPSWNNIRTGKASAQLSWSALPGTLAPGQKVDVSLTASITHSFVPLSMSSEVRLYYGSQISPGGAGVGHSGERQPHPPHSATAVCSVPPMPGGRKGDRFCIWINVITPGGDGDVFYDYEFR